MIRSTIFMRVEAARQSPSPDAAIRVAPPGFSDAEWERFERDGLVVLDERIQPEDVERYRDAVDDCMSRGPGYSSSKTHKASNIVELHPTFTELINHDRHVGYAYDVYGEQLKLIQAECFSRPKGSFANEWHIDGPRVTPYRTFSRWPLKVRVGYWLTDVTRPDMGNFTYVPGSHDPELRHDYVGRESVPEERTLCVEAGTVMVMSGDVWHRVAHNRSDSVRKNLFISYSPSWVAGYHEPSREWVATLSREQRIIMRPYGEDPEAFTRPPAEDLPLFHQRDADAALPSMSDPRIERHKQRRLTPLELRAGRRLEPR
jgi:hypothetical protein